LSVVAASPLNVTVFVVEEVIAPSKIMDDASWRNCLPALVATLCVAPSILHSYKVCNSRGIVIDILFVHSGICRMKYCHWIKTIHTSI